MNDNLFMKEEVLFTILTNLSQEDEETVRAILMKHLDDKQRRELTDIYNGVKLPSLSLDIIAK